MLYVSVDPSKGLYRTLIYYCLINWFWPYIMISVYWEMTMTACMLKKRDLTPMKLIHKKYVNGCIVAGLSYKRGMLPSEVFFIFPNRWVVLPWHRKSSYEYQYPTIISSHIYIVLLSCHETCCVALPDVCAWMTVADKSLTWKSFFRYWARGKAGKYRYW